LSSTIVLPAWALPRVPYRRILVSAREKVTTAIYEGKALRIEGGVYKLKA
jgi:predicted DNA-binding protein (UPF0251 family)